MISTPEIDAQYPNVAIIIDARAPYRRPFRYPRPDDAQEVGFRIFIVRKRRAKGKPNCLEFAVRGAICGRAQRRLLPR
jgi:hypothetical protein